MSLSPTSPVKNKTIMSLSPISPVKWVIVA
jgi:hypothetical protein